MSRGHRRAAGWCSALGLACVATLAAGETAPSPAPAAAATVEQARVALAAGRVSEALALLDTPASAGDPRARQVLGVAHFLAGQPARAVEILAVTLPQLADGSPEQREAVQVLGLAYYLVGRIPEALPLLEQTRTFAGSDPKLAYALGMAYVHTHASDKARQSWARAFDLAPASAAAHLLTAQMMVRAGFNEDAEAELKQAVAKDPRLPQAHLLLGQIALFRGRAEEALKLLETERALHPSSTQALDRLGDAYLRLGRWDAALDVLHRSTWINPYSSAPYILLGRVYLKKADPSNAEGVLRKAVEYDPNNQAAHYLLAQALQQLGRGEEARREFQTAERLPGPTER